jgi:hypothetical protein
MRISLLRSSFTTTMRFGFLNRLRSQSSRLALLAAPAAVTAHLTSSSAARLDAASGSGTTTSKAEADGKVSQ